METIARVGHNNARRTTCPAWFVTAGARRLSEIRAAYQKLNAEPVLATGTRQTLEYGTIRAACTSCLNTTQRTTPRPCGAGVPKSQRTEL